MRKTLQKQKKTEAKMASEKAKLEKAYGGGGKKQDVPVPFLDHLRETEDYMLKLALGPGGDDEAKELPAFPRSPARRRRSYRQSSSSALVVSRNCL